MTHFVKVQQFKSAGGKMYNAHSISVNDGAQNYIVGWAKQNDKYARSTREVYENAFRAARLMNKGYSYSEAFEINFNHMYYPADNALKFAEDLKDLAGGVNELPFNEEDYASDEQVDAAWADEQETKLIGIHGVLPVELYKKACANYGYTPFVDDVSFEEFNEWGEEVFRQMV